MIGTESRVESEVRALGPWFHDLDLHGVRTASDHPLGAFHHEIWHTIEPVFPADMTGMTVLDIGCNAGFYSFRLRERGASVVGVDHDERYLAQARYAAGVLGHDVEFLHVEAYDVGQLGVVFDYVLFLGVLYHLRYPQLALDRIAPIVRHAAVIQSLVRGPDYAGSPIAEDYPIGETSLFEEPGFPAAYFVEHRYAGDPTNWWIPNEAGLAAMIRAAGFRIDRHWRPGICACSPLHDDATLRGAA